MDYTPDCVIIPLSKNGKKHGGQYSAIVSFEDADLAEINWTARIGRSTVYAIRKVGKYPNQTTEKIHRVILERKLNIELSSHDFVDHINGDGLDNRRENLRLATHAQNMKNRGKNNNNTSGYKGVIWNKQCKKWQAVIWDKDRVRHLGLFDDPTEAYAVFCEEAKRLHGQFYYEE